MHSPNKCFLQVYIRESYLFEVLFANILSMFFTFYSFLPTYFVTFIYVEVYKDNISGEGIVQQLLGEVLKSPWQFMRWLALPASHSPAVVCLCMQTFSLRY